MESHKEARARGRDIHCKVGLRPDFAWASLLLLPREALQVIFSRARSYSNSPRTFLLDGNDILAMDDQGDIGVLSNHCVRRFDELVKSLAVCPEELYRHMSPRTVENDFARFKIWCGNLGALQRGRSSLDVRLRDSAVMRETVLRFLSQLQDSLKQSTFHELSVQI